MAWVWLPPDCDQAVVGVRLGQDDVGARELWDRHLSCRLSCSAATRSPGSGGLSSFAEPSCNRPAGRPRPARRSKRRAGPSRALFPKEPAHHVAHAITSPTPISSPSRSSICSARWREARTRRGFRLGRLLQGPRTSSWPVAVSPAAIAARPVTSSADNRYASPSLVMSLTRSAAASGLPIVELQQRRLDRREVAQGLIGAAVLGDLAQDAARLGLVAGLDRGLGEAEARQHAVGAALRRDFGPERRFAPRLDVAGRRRAEEIRRGLHLLVGRCIWSSPSGPRPPAPAASAAPMTSRCRTSSRSRLGLVATEGPLRPRGKCPPL